MSAKEQLSDERAFDDALFEAAKGFGSPENTKIRMKDERASSRTPKEKARRGKKNKSLNFRCSDQTRALVEALRRKFDECNISEVLERAVRALAEKEKVRI